MYDLIEVNAERCVGCNTCLRVCPSPEANIVKILENGKAVTDIDQSKCIGCGECVKACGARARDYNDDTERFFKDLGDRKIVVVAHPAIKSAFPGTWQAVLKWFKQNGADGIYDGAFGADICTWGYVKAIESGSSKNVLSQHCPAVVKYIQTYHPDQIRDLSPVHSPISCEAVYIRDVVKKNYAVAALTPCPAMKLEFNETGHVEYNVTFRRLKEYFRRKRIDFNKAVESGNMHYDFDDQMQGCMGGIFPSPGGLRYNLTINMPSVIAVSSDGAGTLYKELDEYCELPPHRHPDVFEALSCAGGCGCGCGVGQEDDQTMIDIRSIWREVEIDARNRRRVAMNGTDKQFKDFENKINPKSLMRNYPQGAKRASAPSDKELAPVFEQMGKTSDYDRKIDCKACGYDTCRQMAEAVYEGRNVPENCIMCAKQSGGAAPAPAGAALDSEKLSAMAEKVCGFATNLLADIENIYASLSNIDEANQNSASMSGVVENILSKVVGFCEANTEIDSDNLPLLVSTLAKLRTAVASLNSNVNECAVGSATIREAMQEVADATTELNVMANDMVTAISDKY